MKYVMYEVVFVVALILLLGTVGACDVGIISLTQTIIQSIIFIVIAIFSKYMCCVEYNRELRRQDFEEKFQKMKN